MANGGGGDGFRCQKVYFPEKILSLMSIIEECFMPFLLLVPEKFVGINICETAV